MILILLIIILIFIELPYGKMYERLQGSPIKQDPINFSLYNLGINTFIKFKHTKFNNLLDTKICAENLLLFNKFMIEENIPYWLSEGTALGVARDGSFIPWDDDVDISFMHTYRDTFIKNVFPKLRSNGFVIGGSYHDGNFITIHRKGEKMDIDIVQKDGKCMASRTKKNDFNADCNNFLKYLNGMRQVTFLNTTFNVPGDHYLEYLYGDTWKTPLKKKYGE